MRRKDAKQFPWIACHIDREIRFEKYDLEGRYPSHIGNGPGVLEVKIPKEYNLRMLGREPPLPEDKAGREINK